MHSPQLRLAALAAALFATFASASVIVHETLDAMAQRVPLIVRGRVARSVSAWDAEKRTIWTWTEISVTDAIKGKPGGLVLIKQPGGEVGELGQAVAGAATFKEGEDCVLFLEPAPLESSAFMVSGMSAGKILMTEVKGLPTAVRDTTGLAFARPAGGKIAEQVKSPEFLGSPADFIKRIRAAAGGAR
ncbi:MAG: hypothetical protein Q8K32_37710 [Archangium sp.]|nr:hypothetical protein [Archangium sp.]